MAFTANDLAWLVYRRDLVTYKHEKFGTYARSGSAAAFRLQSFTSQEDADLADENICPDLNYTFVDPFAPAVEWISIQKKAVGDGDFADIANFATVYALTTQFRVRVKVTDSNGDCIQAALVARLGTGNEVHLWSTAFEPTGLRYFSPTQFTMPVRGTWRLFLIARDATGRVVEAELRPVGGGAAVQLHVTDGGVVDTPLASLPPGPGYASQAMAITLSCSTGGATIYYQWQDLGVAAGGAWAAYAGVLNQVCTPPGKTLYTYAALGGSTSSAVVRNDYY